MQDTCESIIIYLRRTYPTNAVYFFDSCPKTAISTIPSDHVVVPEKHFQESGVFVLFSSLFTASGNQWAHKP